MLSRNLIGANQIERMPAGVGQLKRLKELNVSNNLIVSTRRDYTPGNVHPPR